MGILELQSVKLNTEQCTKNIWYHMCTYDYFFPGYTAAPKPLLAVLYEAEKEFV